MNLIKQKEVIIDQNKNNKSFKKSKNKNKKILRN